MRAKSSKQRCPALCILEQFFSTFKSSCAVGALSSQIVWRFVLTLQKNFRKLVKDKADNLLPA